MKFSLFSLILAAAVFGSVLPAEAQQVQPAAVASPGATAWQTPDKLRQKLAAEISNRLKDVDAKTIQAFVKSQDNRRLLLMYHLAAMECARQDDYKKHNDSLGQKVQGKKDEITRIEKEVETKKGPEKKNAEFRLSRAKSELKKLQEEAKYPINLAKYEKVLKAILDDADWMEQIAFSGEIHTFTRVVQMIDAIADADSGALKKGVARDTTTAVALEFARNNMPTVDAVERAQYFLKYWRQGRLNSSFDSLPIHHRRVTCGWKPGHRSGTIKAFEWALNNVHLPDWQYPASCWRCGYVLDNVYGDSVHGSHYYAPWEGVATDNHMWLTKNVGGVCGGLSHFGAACACANGVPALTMGEPGHCAYVVLVDGKWTPAYSLTWERGLHWLPWNNNWTYSTLHMMDALYEKKDAAKTRLSNACLVLAEVYRDNQDDTKALACYELSAKAAPFNYLMWKSYSAFLNQKMPKNAEAWKKLNARLCKGMAKDFPEQAAELLKQGILNSLTNSGMSAKELSDACVLFWKHAATMGPDRWYVEKFADEQLKACKKLGGDSEESVLALYSGIIAAAMNHDAYVGTMMSWGNSLADHMSDSGKKKITAAMVKAIGSGKKLDAAQRTNLLRGIILAAEKSRDASTFHSVSKMVDPKEVCAQAAIPAFDPFPGKLVSEGGMPFASSTAEWDRPHTHAGMLTKSGGWMHTEKENNPWVAVKLPKHAYITGIVYAGTHQNHLKDRQKPLQIQVSDTGRDDDWHNVGAPVETATDYVNRIDLSKEKPKALYVRILRTGGPEYFHCSGIYVYGEPAA